MMEGLLTRAEDYGKSFSFVDPLSLRRSDVFVSRRVCHKHATRSASGINHIRASWGIVDSNLSWWAWLAPSFGTLPQSVDCLSFRSMGVHRFQNDRTHDVDVNTMSTSTDTLLRVRAFTHDGAHPKAEDYSFKIHVPSRAWILILLSPCLFSSAIASVFPRS